MKNSIIWALFGNDEDGIYGTQKFRDEWCWGARPCWWVAVLWWLRNPLHNLFIHSLRWRSTNVYGVIRYNTKDGLQFFKKYHFELWQSDDPESSEFKLQAWPPGWSFRTRNLEGCGLWGKWDGRIGFSFRKRNSTPA